MQGTLLKVSEEGTQFRSYYDGKKIDLTPESTVQATRCSAIYPIPAAVDCLQYELCLMHQAQKKIGADIIIPLDELPPYHVTAERLRASVFLSHRCPNPNRASVFLSHRTVVHFVVHLVVHC